MGAPRPRDAMPRLVVTLTFVNVVLLSGYSLSQWVAWGGLGFVTALGASPLEIVLGMAYVVVANIFCAFLFVWLIDLARLPERAWPLRIVVASGAAAIGAAVRSILVFQVSSPTGLADGVAGWVASFAGFLAAAVTALWIGDLLGRARHEQQLRARQEADAARRIARLEFEDTVHRRRVADHLHGSVQNGLVVAAAQLDQVAADLAAKNEPVADEIREATALLDHIREDQVRALSHALFPVGADTGLVRAIGGILDRLPSTLSGELIVGASYRDVVAREGEVTDLPARVIIADTVEEAITNAVKHGRATGVTVSLDLRPESATRTLTLDVSDNGSGLCGSAPRFNGLERHHARIAAHEGTLTLSSADRGTRLSVTLPLTGNSAP